MKISHEIKEEQRRGFLKMSNEFKEQGSEIYLKETKHSDEDNH